MNNIDWFDEIKYMPQRKLIRKISCIHSDLIRSTSIDKYTNYLFVINKKIDELSKLTNINKNFYEVSRMIDFYFQGESFGYYIASRVATNLSYIKKGEDLIKLKSGGNSNGQEQHLERPSEK